MKKYKELAKELNIWLSLGGFQERSDIAGKIYSKCLVNIKIHML